MEIFNIGPLELLLIIVIALIVLGPEDMVRTVQKLAKSIRKIVRSPIWKSLVDTSHEIRQLPKKLMDEAGLDETIDELNQMNEKLQKISKTNPLDPQKILKTEKITNEKKVTSPGEIKDQESPTEKSDNHQEVGEAHPKEKEDETSDLEDKKESLEESRKTNNIV